MLPACVLARLILLFAFEMYEHRFPDICNELLVMEREGAPFCHHQRWRLLL